MQLRFSGLLKDDIEHSGENRDSGKRDEAGEKLTMETVMMWVEQQNTAYEREESGKKKGAITEVRITEVGSR